MAIKVVYDVIINGIPMISGDLLKFKYHGYHNDPFPLVIFVNKVEGMHPKTMHYHRYIQAINLNYLPKSVRNQFAKDWLEDIDKTKHPKLTWQKLKSKYGYVVNEKIFRRYFFKPAYYLKGIIRVPRDKLESEISTNWHKDFSIKARIKLYRGIRKMQELIL